MRLSKTPKAADSIRANISARKLIGLGLMCVFTFFVVGLVVLRSNTAGESEGFLYFMVYMDILFGWWAFAAGTTDFFQPVYVFIAAYSLYAWSAAANEVFYGGQYASIMPTYYRAVIAGMLAFIVGYRSAKKGKAFRKLRRFSLLVSTPRFTKLCWLLTIMFGLVAAFGNFGRTISLSIVDLLRPSTIIAYTEWSTAVRVNQTSTSGLGDFLNAASVTFLIIALVVSSFSRKRPSALKILIVWGCLIPTVMAGHKDVLIFALLLVTMSFHYLIRPITIKLAVVPALCLYVFITIQTHVRNTTDIATMWTSAAQLISEEPAILLPSRSGEFNGPPTALMDIIKKMDDGRTSYTFGKTTLSGFLAVLPRFLWPNRPKPIPEQYMEEFYPSEAMEGKGHAFFIATEGYWALGYLGVAMEMFVYGWLLSLIYGLFVASEKNAGTVAAYAVLYFPLVVTSVRADVMGSLKVALMNFLPFLIILYFSSRIVTAPKSNSGWGQFQARDSAKDLARI
jgi:hypothetical protein